MALTIAADTAAYATPYGYIVQSGPYKIVPVSIVFDSSYPTGGETVRVSGSPISEREKIIGFIQWGTLDAAGAAFIVHYIPSTEKLMVMVGAAGVNVQAANTQDLSTLTIYGAFVVWG